MNKRQAKKRRLLIDLCDDAGVFYSDKASWNALRRTRKDYIRFCNEYIWWNHKGERKTCDIF